MTSKIASILALLLCAATALAQTVRIVGTITDANDRTGLPGASVVIKGTTAGVVADADGRYAIDAPQGATLVFSFVGMMSQEIPIEGRTEINVTMTEDAMTMEEVVITGMTTVDRRLFTGASDHLRAEDMMLSGVADVTRSLEGDLGVFMQNVGLMLEGKLNKMRP